MALSLHKRPFLCKIKALDTRLEAGRFLRPQVVQETANFVIKANKVQLANPNAPFRRHKIEFLSILSKLAIASRVRSRV